MSTAKKKNLPYSYPDRGKNDAQESLRLVKIETERLTEKIQKSVIDNPKLAKKAAMLISLWIEKKNLKTKR